MASIQVTVTSNLGPITINEPAVAEFTENIVRGSVTVARNLIKSTQRGPNGRSLPGNPPANQSGALSASLRHRVEGSRKGVVMARTHYAGYLEDGTRNMAPRPYLERATDTSIRQAPLPANIIKVGGA